MGAHSREPTRRGEGVVQGRTRPLGHLGDQQSVEIHDCGDGRRRLFFRAGSTSIGRSSTFAGNSTPVTFAAKAKPYRTAVGWSSSHAASSCGLSGSMSAPT
ncbi:hypothetical protein SAMN05216276_100248 [Streptosporangium subroseum]|uniref:Uncharacterized protein n=1 Tax=Streptosporangium subroseum TaxID=106412 RepID=A0A239AP04_9ACTN|nr:hypothetical protein SAMN05216276_100248 [Streptosporangium subroseum]